MLFTEMKMVLCVKAEDVLIGAYLAVEKKDASLGVREASAMKFHLSENRMQSPLHFLK